MIALSDGPWKLGVNSVDSPSELLEGQYQWLVNGINKGGIISTRPGWRAMQINGPSDTAKPQAIKLFTPREGTQLLVVAVGGRILYSRYPFDNLTWQQLSGISFDPNGKIDFEIGVVGVTQDDAGNLTVIDPFPVLMMFDGRNRTAFWDGVTARHLDPDPDGAHETPICSFAKWIGNRLWTLQGRRMRVSNELNPLKFTEEDILAEGGYFNLPDVGTGLGVTPDFRSLLAFTDFTTTAFKAGILDRNTWRTTDEFQKVIFPAIGCVSHKSIVNQYGVTWWYSHDGLINLDLALQTYRSASAVRFKDQMMRRSKANLSDNISDICCAAYGNYLMVAVPSGDLSNYHIWIMDGNANESSLAVTDEWTGAWTGIRPVQWAVGVVRGKSRCFCLSNDYPPTDEIDNPTHPINAHIWEMFLQDRRDIGHNSILTTTAQDIPVALETRFLLTNNLNSYFKYAELDLEEIKGTVNVEVFYCARRGTYKKIMEKQIVAQVGSVIATMTLPVIFEEYLPQRRTSKTVSECLISTDTTPIVEAPLTRNKDKSFSILVRWTGQMSLVKIRAYADQEPDQMDGVDEEQELTNRYIKSDGVGAIASSGSPTSLPITPQMSGFINNIYPRWDEGIYKSLWQ